MILPYKSIDETYRRYLFHVPLDNKKPRALILVLSVVKARLDQPPSKSNLPLLIVKGLSRHKTLETPIKYRG